MMRASMSLVAGLMLAVSMPPISWWPLAWLASGLLLLAARGGGARRATALGWLSGTAFYLPVLYWLAPTIVSYTRIGWVTACAIVVLLCAAEACFIAAFTSIVEALACRGIARALAAPAVWALIEWSRTFFPVRFPWVPLATSQVGGPLPLVQMVDLTGTYGLSAAIVLVGALLAESCSRTTWWRTRENGASVAVGAGQSRRPATAGHDAERSSGPWAPLAPAAVVILLVVGYGVIRLSMIEARPVRGRVSVGFVQGNVPQSEKWNPARQDEILSRYLRLSRRAAERGAQLIVWPEAAVPFFIEHDPRRSRIVDLARDTGAWLLVGSPGFRRTEKGFRQLNQAWLIRPDQGLAGSYDKIQLVPFGEYVPFGFLLSWVNKAVEAVGDFGRGHDAIVFSGPPAGNRPVRFGVLICYEGIFPGFTRRFVLGGADLLLNISNDAWYGRSSAPYQHLAMSSLRAVENRVPLVRATNTGISAFVEPTGRIEGRTPLFEESVAVRDVKLRRGSSLYARWGNWFLWLCGLVLAAATATKMGSGSSS